MAAWRKPHYAWIIAAVTFATLLVAGAIRSTPGVLMVPLETEFHWSRATISFAVSVNILLYGLIGPFAAAMMETFGIRRIMLGALAAIGIGIAITPLMQQSWQLVVLWGFVVGAGTGATGSGWLSDRMDNRVLLAVYYGLRGLSLLCLPFAFDSFYTMGLFTLFYGLDWIATVPPTVRLTANAFGRENTGIMFGWISASHQLGGAAAAYFGGVMRVDLGNYTQAFMISGALCFVAVMLVMLIGRGRPKPVRLGAQPLASTS